MKQRRILNRWCSILCIVPALLILPLKGYSQLPVCSGPQSGLIYFLTNTTSTTPCRIYNYNPLLPVSGSNPVLNTIVPPLGSNGLALSKNFSGAGPDPTFYTVINGTYHYYDGSTWINTGHSSGSSTTFNPAGGGAFIYNIDIIQKQVWKYNGTGNATLLFNLPAGYDGVADIALDCEGNFYMLWTNGSQRLEKYNPAGILIATYTVTGLPASIGGGGLAIIGNKLYYDNTTAFFAATITGSTVNFTATNPNLQPIVQDFACCPSSPGSVFADVDTAYYCGAGPGITINATGSGTFNWSVLSGNAIISGTGGIVSVTATQTSRILLKGPVTAPGCGNNTDTVTIVVPTATLYAGDDRIVEGCGFYEDTLSATLSNNTPGLNYAFTWSPAGTIVAAGNTLTPVIRPIANSRYIVKATLPVNQGGCVWVDSVDVQLADITVVADFSTSVTKGCGADTVSFTNQSANATAYNWTFGNGNTSTLHAPVNNYLSSGDYAVRLIAYNDKCADTVSKTVSVDILPLPELYNVSSDMIVKYGDSVHLNADGAKQYSWTPSAYLDNADIKNPLCRPFAPVNYVVTGINEYGCKDSASVKVEIDYRMTEFIPSAFSPNGDGLNDVLRIVNIKYQKLLEFVVVNRFGQIVYSGNDPLKGWDGTLNGVPQDIGVYYYYVKLLIPNGEEHFYKGDVSLIR